MSGGETVFVGLLLFLIASILVLMFDEGRR